MQLLPVGMHPGVVEVVVVGVVVVVLVVEVVLVVVVVEKHVQGFGS